MTFGFDQYEPRRQRFNLRRDLAFAFLDLRQLVLLVNTLACLSIALQHGFSSRGSHGGQFVLKRACLLSCSACCFFAWAEIFADAEFKFGYFAEPGMCLFENSCEFAIFGDVNMTQQFA